MLRRRPRINFSVCLTQVCHLSLIGFLHLLLLSGSAQARDKQPQTPPLRWTEGKPGCTFSRDDDGKYRWGLSADDVRITLAVDSQELQKLHRRIQPLFAVFLSVRYRGAGKMEVYLEKLNIEYAKHFHVVKHPFNPDSFALQIQKDADEMEQQVERRIQKHPEQKEKLETQLQDYKRQVIELTEFVDAHSLRMHTLNPERSEASGWVFFSAKDKWLADWKTPEEFVLRIPLKDRVFEFPFTMPPAGTDDLILRRRPN
jgi:hypothetical protein